MMPERASRTFICSVLFLDIVEYSRKPVAEQIHLKDRFNRLITLAIQEIPAADRIILDTGDGAAINFLGDPEDALFVAMSLRDAFAPEPNRPPEVPARIGINLGPVRMVKDPNGQPNIIGDGINVSQRIMAFAEAGQILVSRSYYETVSHISEGYTELFSYEGSRTDKHVRDHEIYSVGYSDADTALRRPTGSPRRTADDRQRKTVTAAIKHFLPRMGRCLNNRSLAYGTAVFSSGAFLLAVLTSVMGTPPEEYKLSPVRATSKPAKKVAAKPTRKSPVQQSGKASTKKSAPAADAKATQNNVDSDPQVTAAADPEPAPVKKRRFLFFRRQPAPEAAAAENVQETPETVGSEPTSNEHSEPATGSAQAAAGSSDAASSAAVSADAWPSEDASPGTVSSKPVYVDRATVLLAIAPWGEVYVDGNLVGVSPPVNKIDLMPGRRTIEIRNGAFPAFIEQFELKAGQNIKIRHKFN